MDTYHFSKILSREAIQVQKHEARELGIEKAVLLGLIRHADLQSIEDEDGETWVRIGPDDWREIAPWWSNRTIHRHLSVLRESGRLQAQKFGTWDHTLWYSTGE